MEEIIRVSKLSTSEDVIKAFREQVTEVANYLLIPGPSRETEFRVTPPQKTRAVVVDIETGIIRVAQEPTTYVGAVGMENIENRKSLVIIPWTESWWYYTLGASIRIQYIVEEEK